MMKKIKKIIGVLLVVLLFVLSFSMIFSSMQGGGVNEEVKNFCVVCSGRKIFKNTYSFELVEKDAVFFVETLEGEPVKDYSVSVRAAYPKEDFNVVFNDIDVYSWEKDFAAVNYEFGSAGIVKNENSFTVKYTRLTTILAEEFPGMNIRYENLISTKNVLQIDITVSGQTLSIMYYVDIPVSSVELSRESLVW